MMVVDIVFGPESEIYKEMVEETEIEECTNPDERKVAVVQMYISERCPLPGYATIWTLYEERLLDGADVFLDGIYINPLVFPGLMHQIISKRD